MSDLLRSRLYMHTRVPLGVPKKCSTLKSKESAQSHFDYFKRGPCEPFTRITKNGMDEGRWVLLPAQGDNRGRTGQVPFNLFDLDQTGV